MLNALNPGDHDFGYEACMPREILIDGFTVDDSAIADGEPLYFLPDFDPKGVCGTVSPYKVSEKLHIKNLKVKSGRKIELSPKAELYKNTSFILE